MKCKLVLIGTIAAALWTVVIPVLALISDMAFAQSGGPKEGDIVRK